jgi:hypothetical protein
VIDHDQFKPGSELMVATDGSSGYDYCGERENHFQIKTAGRRAGGLLRLEGVMGNTGNKRWRVIFFLLGTLVAVSLSGCMGMAQLKVAKDLEKIQKVYEHPGITGGTPVGYVDLWVATSFGMWMKDLEEGPTSCDGWNIYAVEVVGDARDFIDNEHGYPMRVGSMKQLTWPGTLGSIKYRPIADNFSGFRIPLPAGKVPLAVAYDTNLCPLPDDVAARVKANEPGWSTLKFIDLPVEAGRIQVVQLSLVNHGDRLALYTLLEPTTLPLPKEIDKLSPDPGAYNEYVKFLDSPAWGMRWYGARRLGFIENKAAIPILREKMRSEEHKDVLNELGKAIERLK